jgi:hypothetical protein
MVKISFRFFPFLPADLGLGNLVNQIIGSNPQLKEEVVVNFHHIFNEQLFFLLAPRKNNLPQINLPFSTFSGL